MTIGIQLDVLTPASCESCGLCCEGNGSPVALYASRPEWPSLHPYRPAGVPDELIREIDENFGGLFRGQEPPERCLWFDAEARRCRHYEWRPQFCREYELGGVACLASRTTYLTGDSRAPRTC